MSKPIAINSKVLTTIAGTDLLLGSSPDVADFRAISLDNLARLIRDTISIGGRNYAKGTGTPLAVVGYQSSRYYLAEGLEAGEQVMFSFDFDWEGETKPYLEIYIGHVVAGNFADRTAVKVADVKKGHNSFLLTLKYPPTVAVFFTTSALAVTASRVKVERGNIATDWSPAPEDLGWGG